MPQLPKGKVTPMKSVERPAPLKVAGATSKAAVQKRVAINREIAKRPIEPFKAVQRPAPPKESSSFFGDIAAATGLDSFYKDHILPTVGHVIADQWNAAKATHGVSLLANTTPLGVIGTEALGRSTEAQKKADEITGYGANVVKGAFGLANTKGFEPAKHYIAPAIDGAVHVAGDSKDAFVKAAKGIDHTLSKDVPVYQTVKSWADKNAVKPSKDFVVDAVSHITGTPVNKRIDKADEGDRQFLFQSNDISLRGSEQRMGATPEQRDRWIKMASGQSEDPLWGGYRAPFSDQQLHAMSDYELVNAAYGTHTNVISSVFEAAKQDLKKISSVPASVTAFTSVLDDAVNKKDYRGLGNFAEFVARQGISNSVALTNASVYSMTGGQFGDYKPLVRAMQTEPILTSLDAIATASMYGKAATVALKSGGALTKAGAIASKVPGAVRAGEAVAAGARAAAEVPVIGQAAKGAAAAGRLGRQIADTTEVNIANKRLATLADSGAEVGVSRTIRPSESFFSKASAVAKGHLYSGDNPIAAALAKRGAQNDAATFRAFVSHVVNVMGDKRATPVVRAFGKLFQEDPAVAERVAWELSGTDKVALPSEIGGDVLNFTPGQRADQLDRVLNGELWIKREVNPDGSLGGEVGSHYGPDVPEGEGWRRVVQEVDKETIKKDQSLNESQFNQKYETLNPDEVSTTTANRDFFKRIDSASPEAVDVAKQALEGAYSEAFGARGPSRLFVGFRGEKSPAGSLGELLSRHEAENQASLIKLGKTANPSIADLPGALDIAARERLGIKSASLRSRRARGRGFNARLQDETIVRMIPAVGPKVRAELAAILDEALPEAKATVASAKKAADRLRKQRDAARAVEAEKRQLRSEVKADKELVKSLDGKKDRSSVSKRSAANKRIAAKQQKINELTAKSKTTVKVHNERVKEATATLVDAQEQADAIVRAQADIDMHVESYLRDILETTDTPTGARIHFPTSPTAQGAKLSENVNTSLAGRATPRAMRDIHTAQYALLGDDKTLNRFAGSIARNLRVPYVAHQAVTRLTDYLMRTGTVMHFSDDPEEFARQVAAFTEANILNGNKEMEEFVVLPIDDRTSFLNRDSLDRLNEQPAAEAASKGVSGVGVDDQRFAEIIGQALEDQHKVSLEGMQGKTVVVVERNRYTALQREIAAAAQAPGRLQKLSRWWVRITLSTLPRTPIANIVGSGLLGVLGGGLGGYRDALRLMENGTVPAEITNTGLAGAFGSDFMLKFPDQSRKLGVIQSYMDYIYSYNVMGEDLSRLAAFVSAAKRGLSKSDAMRLDKDLAEVTDMNARMQKLLEAVAKGEFSNGKPLTPELIAIRDAALQKAEDFLGGSRGLTARQRGIVQFIPFWSWYKHIFKLYFYTLPVKYPGRAIALNELARIGAEESARQGFYDSFYNDAIGIGNDVFGSNVYRKGIKTNIYPFTFGGFADQGEGAPGVQFALSNVSPVLTLPARLAGIGIPGAPIIGANGQQLTPGDIQQPGYAEAAASELERAIAPLGVLQSALAPRTSLAFDVARLASGNQIPQPEQRGLGTGYAVTPRGANSLLGPSEAILEGAARAFGLSFVRNPIQGPVAQRRLTYQEEQARQTALDNYRRSKGYIK